MDWSGRACRALIAVAGTLALGVPVACAGTAAAVSAATPAATSPSSPVDLAARVNFGAGVASRGAIVSAGDARFEVLGDGLIRMEYSPGARFENLPTVNVLDRRFAVPPYRTAVRHGWLTITTRPAPPSGRQAQRNAG